MVDQVERRARGAYTTPAHLVSYLVERSLGAQLAELPPGRRPTLRVLDPACGLGVLLAECYRQLESHDVRRLRHLGREEALVREEGRWRPTRARRARLLVEHLVGVDIDAEAVRATRAALAQVAGVAPDGLEHTVRRGDALVGPDLDAHLGLDWETAFPEVFTGGEPGFDLVIANPPYLSWSGRHAVALDPVRRAAYTSRYRSGGWPAAHSLFLERAATLLGRDCLAMVLPAQVGFLEGYRVVRGVLSERAGLVEVRYWGEGVFEEAVTPVLTVVARRDHRGSTRIVEGGRAGRVELDGDRAWTVVRDQALLAHIARGASSLGSMVADPGVHTGNCARHLIHDRAEAPPTAVPVLEGRQVHRYRCEPPARALDLAYEAGPGEYYTIRPVARYRAARFLVRQTASYPIVGPRRGAEYFRNSLLALFDPPEWPDVRYLVGLLNSRLMRFVYQATVPEAGQRAFPQVKVRALRALPIRVPDRDDPVQRVAHDRVVALVDQLLVAHGGSEQAVATLEEAVDREVYAIYELDATMVARVEQTSAIQATDRVEQRGDGG